MGGSCKGDYSNDVGLLWINCAFSSAIIYICEMKRTFINVFLGLKRVNDVASVLRGVWRHAMDNIRFQTQQEERNRAKGEWHPFLNIKRVTSSNYSHLRLC